MARKKDSNGSNKSQLIRQAMEQGIVSPRDISAHLKDVHGIEASPAYVSTIKSNMKRKSGSPAKTKGPRVKKAAKSLGEISLSAGVVDFVRSVGGIDAARKQLDLLDEIKRM